MKEKIIGYPKGLEGREEFKVREEDTQPSVKVQYAWSSLTDTWYEKLVDIGPIPDERIAKLKEKMAEMGEKTDETEHLDYSHDYEYKIKGIGECEKKFLDHHRTYTDEKIYKEPKAKVEITERFKPYGRAPGNYVRVYLYDELNSPEEWSKLTEALSPISDDLIRDIKEEDKEAGIEGYSTQLHEPYWVDANQLMLHLMEVNSGEKLSIEEVIRSIKKYEK